MRSPLKKLLRFYRNLPIRSKMLLILYIQIIIPLILIGFFSFRNSESIIKKKSENYSTDVLQMIKLRLADHINNLAVISQDLLYDMKIYEVLNSEVNSKDIISGFEQENEISNVFTKLILARPEIQSICIVSKDGAYYYKDDKSKITSIKDILPYEKVLERARRAKGLPVWYVDAGDGQVKNIFMARTLHNLDDYEEIGLQVILVRKEFLESVYDGLKQEVENIAIVTGANERIVSRNPEDPLLSDPGFYENINGEEGSREDRSSGTFVTFISLEEPDWKIVSYVYLRDLYRDADSLKEQIAVLCVLAFITLSVFSTLIAFDFIIPINRLVGGMKKVQKGEGAVYIDNDREDELGYLSKSFNEMSGEIHHLLNWVYREQITRKEAEIKALQSQINPHFLFNTLESINWMAQLNNVPEISRTVSDLSSLMEAGIGRDDRLISFEEELSYMDKYISLIKRRYEDRFEFIKDVDREVMDVKIPRLLIQPLVENAVHHGIETTGGTGIIKLIAKIEDRHLAVEIIDNGAGIPGERLEEINRRLSMDNNTYFKSLGENKRKSIGIENVNRRIKLFYGESYGLKLESEEGVLTKVIVTIPVEPNESREGYYVKGADNR